MHVRLTTQSDTNMPPRGLSPGVCIGSSAIYYSSIALVHCHARLQQNCAVADQELVLITGLEKLSGLTRPPSVVIFIPATSPHG